MKSREEDERHKGPSNLVLRDETSYEAVMELSQKAVKRRAETA